ncbi:MAG: hypothetical protein JXO51_10175 [Candidatus Aminicenantes bacterium]|nr:hypothetical protein [Candidatus Aminicenantes bacterium]
METIRRKKMQEVEVKKCPACKKKHKFNVAILTDEAVGGFFLMVTRIETISCSFTCPDTGTTIVVEVPVTLTSGQSIAGVQ